MQKIFELWESAEETDEKLMSTKDFSREIPKTSVVGQMPASGSSQAEQVPSGTKAGSFPPKDGMVPTKRKHKSKVVPGSIHKATKAKVKSKTTFAADTKPEFVVDSSYV